MVIYICRHCFVKFRFLGQVWQGAFTSLTVIFSSFLTHELLTTLVTLICSLHFTLIAEFIDLYNNQTIFYLQFVLDL